nr:hypothetical protein Iba_chr02cCG4920 [Ipomoea batatas]
MEHKKLAGGPKKKKSRKRSPGGDTGYNETILPRSSSTSWAANLDEGSTSSTSAFRSTSKTTVLSHDDKVAAVLTWWVRIGSEIGPPSSTRESGLERGSERGVAPPPSPLPVQDQYCECAMTRLNAIAFKFYFRGKFYMKY